MKHKFINPLLRCVFSNASLVIPEWGPAALFYAYVSVYLCENRKYVSKHADSRCRQERMRYWLCNSLSFIRWFSCPAGGVRLGLRGAAGGRLRWAPPLGGGGRGGALAGGGAREGVQPTGSSRRRVSRGRRIHTRSCRRRLLGEQSSCESKCKKKNHTIRYISISSWRLSAVKTLV